MPVSSAAPLTASRFSITLDGAEIASFSELQGIVAEVEPVQYIESSATTITTKTLGKAKPPQVVLKRGMTGALDLWTWHETVRSGNAVAARRNCSLTMFAADGKAVARYALENAWPSKLEVGAMKDGASAIMFETVTLVCERLQRVSV